jgi:NAD-dependent deacetylase
MEYHKLKVVVLTGAGVSAESGIPTFRDAGGLWEGHDVMSVASPEGWRKNRELVLDFYNARRAALRKAKPNKAHFDLVALEENFNTVVVTQNIDDLHERAGSSKVIHLHGELLKAQSTLNPLLVYELGSRDIQLGDKCNLGSQLRPFVVWFGEPVPKLEAAVAEIANADFLLIIGTSLQVYPAAGLMHYAPQDCPILLVDPQIPDNLPDHNPNIYTFKSKASEGVKIALQKINELTKAAN